MGFAVEGGIDGAPGVDGAVPDAVAEADGAVPDAVAEIDEALRDLLAGVRARRRFLGSRRAGEREGGDEKGESEDLAGATHGSSPLMRSRTGASHGCLRPWR